MNIRQADFKIKMNRVESSHIESIGYDKSNSDLYVQFKNGLYKYINVDENTYNGLLMAESKGVYLNTSVKGYFEYQLISLI